MDVWPRQPFRSFQMRPPVVRRERILSHLPIHLLPIFWEPGNFQWYWIPEYLRLFTHSKKLKCTRQVAPALSVTRELGWSVSSPSASPKFWGCSSFFFNWFSHFPAGAHSLSRVLGFTGYMDPSTSCSHSWHERHSGPGSLLDTTSMISFAPNR